MIMEVYDKRLKESIFSQEVFNLPKKVIVEYDGVFKQSGKKADRITSLIMQTLLKVEQREHSHTDKFLEFKSPKVFDYACHSNSFYVGVTL